MPKKNDFVKETKLQAYDQRGGGFVSQGEWLGTGEPSPVGSAKEEKASVIPYKNVIVTKFLENG